MYGPDTQTGTLAEKLLIVEQSYRPLHEEITELESHQQKSLTSGRDIFEIDEFTAIPDTWQMSYNHRVRLFLIINATGSHHAHVTRRRVPEILNGIWWPQRWAITPSHRTPHFLVYTVGLTAASWVHNCKNKTIKWNKMRQADIGRPEYQFHLKHRQACSHPPKCACCVSQRASNITTTKQKQRWPYEGFT